MMHQNVSTETHKQVLNPRHLARRSLENPETRVSHWRPKSIIKNNHNEGNDIVGTLIYYVVSFPSSPSQSYFVTFTPFVDNVFAFVDPRRNQSSSSTTLTQVILFF
jgi:hypothetical protein